LPEWATEYSWKVTRFTSAVGCVPVPSLISHPPLSAIHLVLMTLRYYAELKVCFFSPKSAVLCPRINCFKTVTSDVKLWSKSFSPTIFQRRKAWPTTDWAS